MLAVYKSIQHFVTISRVNVYSTVLPTKSDSGLMFCLQRYQDLESIDHSCINPIHRLMFYITIVNKTRHHCHSRLAGQYLLVSTADDHCFEPEQVPNCLTMIVFLKESFKQKRILKRKNQLSTKSENYQACKELKNEFSCGALSCQYQFIP